MYTDIHPPYRNGDAPQSYRQDPATCSFTNHYNASDRPATLTMIPKL